MHLALNNLQRLICHKTHANKVSLQRGKIPSTSRLGLEIHWLHLCRGVKLPQHVSWIWHQTIWWWGTSNAVALGNAKHPSIAITPRSTLVATDRVLSLCQVKLNCLLMQNLIVWNRPVYTYKMDLTFNNQQRLICHKRKPN